MVTVYVAVTIGMAIIGDIFTGMNDWYPFWKNAISHLAGDTSRDYVREKDSFSYMFSNGLINILDMFYSAAHTSQQSLH